MPVTELEKRLKNAIENYNLGEAAIAIGLGADVNCIDGNNSSALLIAVARLFDELVEVLIDSRKELNLDINKSNNTGWFPITILASIDHTFVTMHNKQRKDQIKILELLLSCEELEFSEDHLIERLRYWNPGETQIQMEAMIREEAERRRNK